MLPFHIESSSGLSAYRQLVEQVRYFVASGVLKPGDQLPSVRGLAKDLSINPATVVKAFNVLQTEGFIELRQGKGAFVLDNVLKNNPPNLEHMNELQQKAKSIALLAHKLNLSEEDLTKLIQQNYKEIDQNEDR